MHRQRRFIEEEDTEKVNERIDRMLSDQYSSEEDTPRASKYRNPDFDSNKIAQVLLNVLRPNPKPVVSRPQTITGMTYEIILTNLLLILRFVVPSDLFEPIETFAKERILRMLNEETAHLRTDYPRVHRILRVICALVYYTWKYRLVVAFLNGFLWGYILFNFPSKCNPG